MISNDLNVGTQYGYKSDICMDRFFGLRYRHVLDSGTEATEGALKFARKYGKLIDTTGQKTEIVSFNEAFHGRSMGALSVTHQKKYQAPFEPLVPGCVEAEFNNIASIKQLVTEKTCGVIVEPIQGEGGIMPAREEWLRALRKRCDEVRAVLIYDEIQASRSLQMPRSFVLTLACLYTVRSRPDGQIVGAFILPQRLPPRHYYDGKATRKRYSYWCYHDERQGCRCHQDR